MENDHIFIDGACEITGYSKSTIYQLVHKKEIPFHKVAGRRKLFFLRSELLGWMGAPALFVPTIEYRKI